MSVILLMKHFSLPKQQLKKNSWDRCCQIMGLAMPLAMLPSYIKVLFQVCCSSYPASCCTPGKAVGDDPSTCFSTTCVEDLERVPDFCQCLSLSHTDTHTEAIILFSICPLCFPVLRQKYVPNEWRTDAWSLKSGRGYKDKIQETPN